MDDIHRKLFVIKQPGGCKFMHKMHENTFGSALNRCGAELMRSYRPLSRNGGVVLRESEEEGWMVRGLLVGGGRGGKAAHVRTMKELWCYG